MFPSIKCPRQFRETRATLRAVHPPTLMRFLGIAKLPAMRQTPDCSKNGGTDFIIFRALAYDPLFQVYAHLKRALDGGEPLAGAPRSGAVPPSHWLRPHPRIAAGVRYP